jgi:hypothetical protein
MNTLGETVVVYHTVDRQILDRDQIKGVDDATAVLVSKIAPPPRDALMHPRDHLAPLGIFRRPVLFSAEATLDFGERLLLLPEEAWIVDFVPSRERGKGLEAHVNADLLPRFPQRGEFRTLTREADVPLLRAATANRGSLGRTLKRAMQEQFDISHIGDAHALLFGFESAATGTCGKVMLS